MKKLFSILFALCIIKAKAQTLPGFTTAQSTVIRTLVKQSTDSGRNESKAAIAALPKIDTGSFILKNGVLYVNFATVLTAVNAKADSKTVTDLTTRIAAAETKIATKADNVTVNLATTRIADIETWQDNIEIQIAAMLALSNKIDTWIKFYTK